MDPLVIGILGVIVLFSLLFLGMNVGACMGFVAFIGIVVISGVEPAVSRLGQTAFSTASNYLISVIPLFMLMSEFAFVSGLTRHAFKGVYKWLGSLPGGLTMATVGACSIFAGACGSSAATASTIGSVALPEMRKFKYDPGLSAGSVAGGGTLGILIPPSLAFILYGLITQQSIGKLFIGGVFPGILLTCLYIIAIYILVKRNPSLGPRGPKTSPREKLTAFKDIWSVAVLFLVVMGGIYSGIFTPTEAAAVGALCSFLMALGGRRLTRGNVITSFMEALKVTGMILVILIGAILFGYFAAVSGLAMALVDFVTSLALPPLSLVIMMLIIFAILGCVMDSYAMVMLIVPIFMPLIVYTGVDLIWFGVLTVMMMEVGLITPPIGLNVFVIKGIAPSVPTYTIFRGIIPFVAATVVCVAIVVAFPQIALFLPNTIK